VTDELSTVVANGNGSSPRAETLEDQAPAKLCPVCQKVVPDDRKVTCSSACARERDPRTRTKPRPKLARATFPPEMLTGRPNVPNEPSAPAPGFAAAAMALVAGLGDLGGVERLTIELGGRVIEIR
jgi:hypothetical protein